MVCPIIGDCEPPRRSGITNSPTMGMKHKSTPASMPEDDNGSVTNQKILQPGAPRSAAASISDSSSFSSVAYSGSTMNGKYEENTAIKIAGSLTRQGGGAPQ